MPFSLAVKMHSLVRKSIFGENSHALISEENAWWVLAVC